ncbi:MAG: ATP-dependent zinc metalloprotease FtsH [Candidatus Melainabacteria bacterium]|nr:ATP-dependent zinc metalloprotease FtsH [Candidatus Melainabacteria bacterium]
MKNKRKAGLIAISISALVLIVLAFFGVFNQKTVPRLPEEAANMRSIPSYELDRVFNETPGSIERITCFKGLRTVIADISPLGPSLVDYANANALLAKAAAAHVPVQISETVHRSFVDRLIYSLHWSFWMLLGVCVLGALVLLFGEKVFRRLDVNLPGLDSFNPTTSETAAGERRTFDDVAGCEEAITKLRRVSRWLKSPDWYEQFGAKIPKGILAVGPPGTGKTLLARALAGEVDANFFSANGSTFVEMFAGVGARRVRKLFAEAVAARKKTGKPSIIFIDEIDAIGKKRGQGSSGADSERDQTLNQLLVCMQGFESSSGILVMAATNMVDSLDEALKRPGRFDYQVSVDLPDTLGREKIFMIHTRNMKLASNVRLHDLAVRTPQFSGADIEQACNEAAISAAERIEILHDKSPDALTDADKVISLEDFDTGIDYVQFGDPMLSRARAMSQEDKRNTAYHEAGHCAVQQALQVSGADPITKVTIEPRTKSLGSMQSHAVGDRYGYTEEQLRARIMTAMGGRIAQVHFLQRKDTGAANDFEQATKLARAMVTEFGMSRLEPFSVKLSDDGQRPTKIGDELANEIDAEWRRIIDECYQQAKRHVVENERRIERVAEALLAEQTLLGERFLELWNGQPDAVTKKPILVEDAINELESLIAK